MRSTRIWLWPNLLSLDAPLVAVLWQVLFVRCLHGSLGGAAAALLVMAVWLIYAADRMLDAWRGDGLTPRHLFYRRNWAVVMPVWLMVLGAGMWVARTQLPAELWTRGWIIGAGAALYMATVHAAPRALRWLKEAAVGAVFAAGVSVAAWPVVRTWVDVLAIGLFCALCWANCVAIEDWERRIPARAVMWWVVGGVSVAAVVLIAPQRPVLASAEVVSALGLAMLDRRYGRMSADAMRVLADAVLLSPLLLLPLAGKVA